jgi:putative sterol carrier protein
MGLTSVTELAELTPEQALAWFRTEDPERVVALVDAASDRELERLVAVDRLRRAAQHEVLSRLGEFAVAERLATLHGRVAFEVDQPKGGPERSVLEFDGSGVRLLEEPSDGADVVVRLGAVDFLRLVTGGANAAALLLGARLVVEGDVGMALRVGGVFQVPGRPGVAVDPDEVDPDEIAAVLKGVKESHLREVMQGGFREVVLGQVFRRFPDFLDQGRAADADLSVGFKIGGRKDGESDRYVVTVADGACSVEEGALARDATLVLDGAAFLKLVTGHLNPVTAVLRGSIKVRGDVSAALALHKMMRMPGKA